MADGLDLFSLVDVGEFRLQLFAPHGLEDSGLELDRDDLAEVEARLPGPADLASAARSDDGDASSPGRLVDRHHPEGSLGKAVARGELPLHQVVVEAGEFRAAVFRRVGLVLHDLGEAVVTPLLEGEFESPGPVGGGRLGAVALVEAQESLLDRAVGDQRRAQEERRFDG